MTPHCVRPETRRKYTSTQVVAQYSLESPVSVDAEGGGGEVDEVVRVAEVRAPRVRERAVRGLVEVRHLRYHLEHVSRWIIPVSGLVYLDCRSERRRFEVRKNYVLKAFLDKKQP